METLTQPDELLPYYHDYGSEKQKIGRRIYHAALSDRRGFRDDQIGIDSEDDVWLEIFEAIGESAIENTSASDKGVVDVDWDEMQRFIEAGADEPDWDASWVIDRVRTCINANTRPTPRIDDQVDVEELARAILKDQVGLSIDADTATITMQPDSFYRCIRAAHYNLTRKGE